MRVLVTGSAGFIGSWVTAELAARGHAIVPFDHPCDVRSAAQLEVTVRKTEPGAVINLAGALGTGELIGAERGAADVNILGAVNVYDVAASHGIPVVQIGTGHKGQPNPYAITKACAEDLGLARARWLGEKIAVVRAYHVYGGGQKPPPPWGSSPVRKIIPAFACAALAGQPLEVYGDGRQVIDLVHASNVAKVLVDAIGGPYGEVTEAGTAWPHTVVNAALDVVSAVTGEPQPDEGKWIRHVPMRPGEPDGAWVVAGARACPDPWPYLLHETLEWYRQWLARSSP